VDLRREPSSIGSRLIGAADAVSGPAGKSGPERNKSSFTREFPVPGTTLRAGHDEPDLRGSSG
jgi:hypothetical protein